MKRAEFSLPSNGRWQTLNTKYSPLTDTVTPNMFTAGSTDFITHLSGDIEKRWTDQIYNTSGLVGPLADQFEMVFSNGTRHLLFRNKSTLYYSPGNGATYPVFPVNPDGSLEYTSYLNRAYIDNGIDTPFSYDIVGTYGGVNYLPVEVIISTYSDLTGSTFTIGTTSLVEGTAWHAATSNNATAASLQTAINAIVGAPYNATISGSIITVTLTSPGYTVPVAFSVSAGYTISPISFPRIRAMGVPTPSSAVTFGTNTSGGEVPDGAHTYVVTFLYYDFEESNGGPVSAIHTVSSTNQTVHLTSVPVGAYGVSARNIYRDNNDGNWLLIGTINDNTTTTYTDTSLVGTTQLEITNGEPPIWGLCTQWLSRTFVAKVQGNLNTIYWSTAGEPDSWNPSNYIVCNPADIVQALVVYQGTLYVFNQFSFGFITGNTDNTFAYQAIPSQQVGCVDNRSIQIRVIDGLPLLLFLAAKGVYAFNGSTLTYISDPIEPDLNLNIAQTNLLSGVNTQSTQSDWESGTSTPGIDLVDNPGVLQTINPTVTYSGEPAWVYNSGAGLTNLCTEDGSNALEIPVQFAPALSAAIPTGQTYISSGITPALTQTTSAFFQAGANTNISTTAFARTISKSFGLLDGFPGSTLSSAWTIEAFPGSVSVSGGYLHLENDNILGCPFVPFGTNASGTWEWTVQGSTNSNGINFEFLNTVAEGAGGYTLSFQGGNLRLFYGVSTVLGGPVSCDITSTKTIRATRSTTGTFNIYINGTLAIGPVANGTITAGSYFDIFCNDSYAANYTVGPIYYSPDVLLPAVTTTNSQAVCIVTIDQLNVPTSEGTIVTNQVILGSVGGGAAATPTVTISTATSASPSSGYTAFTPLTGVTNSGTVYTGNIASPVNRYLQVKFTFSCPSDSNGSTNVNASDNQTTSISELAISWTPDSMLMNTINGSSLSTAGTWTSPTYDTFSLGQISSGLSLALSAYYPTNTAISVEIDGATDPYFGNIVSTQTLSSPTTTTSLTVSGARYWRTIYTLTSSDGVYSPQITAPVLNFNTTGTWLSPIITTTTDATSFISLVVGSTVPSGTSVTTTIRTGATATPDGSWSSFSAVGSAVINKYAQIQCVLVADTTDDTTPTVSSISLNWNLTSTFISQAIDTLTTPSGWGLFEVDDFLNGGTATFYFRTAATLPGLSSATFTAISSGQVPANTPLEFCQWKVVFTVAPNNVPEVNAVTVNWLVGNLVPPIRVASLFFDKTYYLFAATSGSSTNNVAYVFDYLGNWRQFSNINVASAGTYFALPYYLDSIRNNIYQWEISLTGTGTVPFMMDIRTKDFNLSDISTLKNVRSLWISGYNTGTTINVYYSADNGNTWVPMLNSLTGTAGYTTTDTGTAFNAYFLPDYSMYTNIVEGVSMMFRVTSSDAYPCRITFIRPCMLQRQGKYIGMGL